MANNGIWAMNFYVLKQSMGMSSIAMSVRVARVPRGCKSKSPPKKLTSLLNVQWSRKHMARASEEKWKITWSKSKHPKS